MTRNVEHRSHQAVRHMGSSFVILSLSLCIGLAVTGGAFGESRSSLQVGSHHLQSNFWVNLHQRLLHAAHFKSPPPEGLTEAELTTWNEAVGTYREATQKRSPIFDAELIAINAALAAAEPAELPAKIPDAIASALEKTKPIYEKNQWPKDDHANRFWMAIAEPMLASAGPELIEAHEKAYGIPFPPRILVDVASYAWEFGGYTVGDRLAAHAVISSVDPGYQGFSGLELIMHESSHAIIAPTFGAIGADLSRAAAELEIKPRWNLWHAIQFYTSGELTRRALARRGVTYEPHIVGMYSRGFRDYRKALETHWQAYLDGEISSIEAMRRILVDTAEVKP